MVLYFCVRAKGTNNNEKYFKIKVEHTQTTDIHDIYSHTAIDGAKRYKYLYKNAQLVDTYVLLCFQHYVLMHLQTLVGIRKRKKQHKNRLNCFILFL